jgi:hypothetical protein
MLQTWLRSNRPRHRRRYTSAAENALKDATPGYVDFPSTLTHSGITIGLKESLELIPVQICC